MKIGLNMVKQWHHNVWPSHVASLGVYYPRFVNAKLEPTGNLFLILTDFKLLQNPGTSTLDKQHEEGEPVANELRQKD